MTHPEDVSMSIKRLAGFVRRVTTDVARVAAALEILALPSAFLEIHAGQIVARCSCCRQVTRLVVPGELGQIAAVLATRPDPETRTWQASESVADLERENREHGISVPGGQPDEPPAAGAPVPIRPHPPKGPMSASISVQAGATSAIVNDVGAEMAPIVDTTLDPIMHPATSREGGAG